MAKTKEADEKNYQILKSLQQSYSEHVCQKLLNHFLILCQCIGLFPIHNVLTADHTKSRFKWISWKTSYTISISVFSIICSLLGFYKAGAFSPSFCHFITPVVFAQAATASLVSVKIAKKGNNFIADLTELEIEINRKYGTPKNFTRFLDFVIFSIFTIGFVEHWLEIIRHTFYLGLTGFLNYTHRNCSYVFYDCNVVWSIIFWIFCGLIWTICVATDVFIIILSIIFASRFRQISEAIDHHNQINETTSTYIYSDKILKFYMQIGEDYNKLTLAVYKLDKLLGSLIICSYVSNISLILIQLFNSFRPFKDDLDTVHFFYSFGFIIMRLLLVTIYAASINEESKRISLILHSVPDDVWNLDLDRVLTRINYDSTTLTGANFFKITRGAVVNIAASIITYELILIQFNRSALMRYTNLNNTIVPATIATEL